MFVVCFKISPVSVNNCIKNITVTVIYTNHRRKKSQNYTPFLRISSKNYAQIITEIYTIYTINENNDKVETEVRAHKDHYKDLRRPGPK